jgi:elongation factor 1 alpha-like protein
VEFHIHHVKEAARVTKIVALLDKTGKPSKSAPRFLKSKQNALIQVINELDHCEWLSFRLPNDDHKLFTYQYTVFLAIFQVTLDEAVCVQEFSKSRALGRAYLRSSGRTIAVGVVNQIIGQDQN